MILYPIGNVNNRGKRGKNISGLGIERIAGERYNKGKRKGGSCVKRNIDYKKTHPLKIFLSY